MNKSIERTTGWTLAVLAPLVLVGGLVLSTAGCRSKTVSTEGTAEQAGTYSCPMHPEVRQATPGTCPDCGMALELEE